jgi:UDPglucose 6-dehydrogenase
MPEVEMCPDPYTMAAGCDALLVVTEWNEFKQLDLGQIRERMRQPLLLDGRNIYDPVLMKAQGFVYRGIGRGYNGEALNGNAEHQIIETAA